jgi:hypothetical protein
VSVDTRTAVGDPGFPEPLGGVLRHPQHGARVDRLLGLVGEHRAVPARSLTIWTR